ncbi:hypothetical protein [Halobellus rarus]|uniref:Uncharacterized protein n=1 Tax=Halobellus rarus TaxID=1126237 RepID=A0ABD6CRY6_9EURY|nr:hypothetical protein [Halobellus rarus]
MRWRDHTPRDLKPGRDGHGGCAARRRGDSQMRRLFAPCRRRHRRLAGTVEAALTP